MMFFCFALTFLLQGPLVRVESILVECKDAVSVSAGTDGSFYICDRMLNSVIHFSKGNIKTIGGLGWSNDGFDNPNDVSSSFLLDVFVTDKNNNRIQRFDKNMTFVESLSKNTLINIDTFYPQACAVSTLGELFVIETDKRRIVKINRENKVVGEFASFNDGRGALRTPRDICISSDNEVAVLDHDRIILFDSFGNYLRTIVLQKDQHWNSVSANAEYVIVTSPQRITVFNSNWDFQYDILPSDIIGYDFDEFRDAYLYEKTLFILSPKALLGCSLSTN